MIYQKQIETLNDNECFMAIKQVNKPYTHKIMTIPKLQSYQKKCHTKVHKIIITL